ncbi:hypothetical protein SRHO_G00188390 [Serrasalmus rhombeus]
MPPPPQERGQCHTGGRVILSNSPTTPGLSGVMNTRITPRAKERARPENEPPKEPLINRLERSGELTLLYDVGLLGEYSRLGAWHSCRGRTALSQRATGCFVDASRLLAGAAGSRRTQRRLRQSNSERRKQQEGKNMECSAESLNAEAEEQKVDLL